MVFDRRNETHNGDPVVALSDRYTRQGTTIANNLQAAIAAAFANEDMASATSELAFA